LPAGKTLPSGALFCAGIKIPNAFDGRGSHFDTHASAGPLPRRDMSGLGSSPHGHGLRPMGRGREAGYKVKALRAHHFSGGAMGQPKTAHSGLRAPETVTEIVV
jgi:hypothetical protein